MDRRKGGGTALKDMRRRAREIAMELLYQNTINQVGVEELMDDYFENSETTDKEDADQEYLEKVLSGVQEHLPEIDALIEKYLVNWKIGRVSKINLSILRLGTYEILYLEDIPNTVSINEGVEMAKKYSDDTGGGFVNGILDKISKNEDQKSAEIIHEILAKQRQADEKLAAEKLAEEKLAEEKLAAETLAAMALAEEKRLADNLAEEKLAMEILAEKQLTLERLAAEKQEALRLAEEAEDEERMAEEAEAEERMAEEAEAEERLTLEQNDEQAEGEESSTLPKSEPIAE